MLSQDKKFPEPCAKHFGLEIVKGLAYLHTNGIIYGDLKPSTLLFNEYNSLKLADFGKARKITDHMNPDQESYARAKTGSPYYMAPELFQDDGVYSFASDLWSFGCLMFEFLTGKPPFSSSSLNKLIKMIQEDPVPLHILQSSNELQDLISQLLEKDPLKRIGWEELLEHPYFSERIENLSSLKFPNQPQFDEYIRNRGIDPEHYKIHRHNNFAKKLMQPHNPKNLDVMRLSYNVKKNMENGSYNKDKLRSDDVHLNNQNIELDFAEENDEDDNGQADEYSTPLERENNDPPIKTFKNSNIDNIMEKPSKPSFLNNNITIPGQKVFDKSERNRFDENKPLETEEFKNDKEYMNINMLHAEKRDFKHLTNINNSKPRKIVSAHSDVDSKLIENKYLDTETDDTDERQFNKFIMNKNKSVPNTMKKNESVASHHAKILENKHPLMAKAKSSKHSAHQKDNVRSPNTIKFYPDSSGAHQVLSTECSEVKSTGSKTIYKVQRQNSFKTDCSQAKKMCPKPIEQLMIHHSDTAVKPIIGNKDIEKSVEPMYKSSYLTFIPWSAEEFERKIDSPEIENYLSEIYNGIVSNNNLTERVHTLSYFESIITNSNVSNKLINSAFFTLFVHMLGKYVKSHTIKIWSIIGLLIRHATVIENEVAESGICTILWQTLTDDNKNVRRKAIAALGEYLFYAATQLDDDQASGVWEIPQEAINWLLKCINPMEDEIVKFYACKAVENISAQSQSAGYLLATKKTCKCLLEAFLNGGKPSFISTSAVALSNIWKLNPSLFSIVIEVINLEEFWKIAVQGQSRIQQAFVTMLNIALLNENEILLEAVNEYADVLAQTVIQCLENQSLVIRGKSLLTVVLLVKHYPVQWYTMFVSDNKFIHIIDRLTKDSYKYVQYGLMHFIDQINQTIPIILGLIQEDLAFATEEGDTKTLECDSIVSMIMERRKDFKNLTGHMTLVSLLLVSVNSGLMKNRIINEHFLSVIANILKSCEVTMFQGADEFVNAVLAIVESFSANQKSLMNNTIPTLEYILPALIKNLRSESNDVKFLSLKIFIDIIIQYINDNSIFDLQKLDMSVDESNPSISQQDSTCKYTTQLMNDILINDLLSNYNYMWEETDPMPLFAIKLLSALTDRSYEFVTAIEKLGILQTVIEFYSFGHKRLNRNTIRIIKCIIENPETSLESIYEFGLIENTLNIIDNMLDQNQDWWFDVLTATLYSIIDRVVTYVEQKQTIEDDQNILGVLQSLIMSAYSWMELLNTDYGFVVIDKASKCLITILTKFADRYKNQL